MAGGLEESNNSQPPMKSAMDGCDFLGYGFFHAGDLPSAQIRRKYHFCDFVGNPAIETGQDDNKRRKNRQEEDNQPETCQKQNGLQGICQK